MPNVAEFVLNRLGEWGAERVYGYPGDGINGLPGAFREVGVRPMLEVVLVESPGHLRRNGERETGLSLISVEG